MEATGTGNGWPRRGPASRRVLCQNGEAGKVEISLTKHALDRFGERVRPALDQELLAQELGALIEEFGRILKDPPDWQAERARQTSDFYIEVTPDLIIPVNRGRDGCYATTVLTRTGISDKSRENRNRRNQAKKQRRKARRGSHR